MARVVKHVCVCSFRLVRSFLSLVLAALLLLLLIPTDPFGEEGDRGADQIEESRAERIHETFKVYSILTSQGMGLSPVACWLTARAIREESKKYSLDPMLVVAVISVESHFQRNAVSTAGARGLMQIHPLTAKSLAKEAEIQHWEGVESLNEPVLNIKLGTFYLAQMKKRFRKLELALSAYNLGPSAVRERLNDGEDIPFDYARKVLASHRVYKREEKQQTAIVLPAAFFPSICVGNSLQNKKCDT